MLFACTNFQPHYRATSPPPPFAAVASNLPGFDARHSEVVLSDFWSFVENNFFLTCFFHPSTNPHNLCFFFELKKACKIYLLKGAPPRIELAALIQALAAASTDRLPPSSWPEPGCRGQCRASGEGSSQKW
jgi:hypothetical protein